MRSVRDLVRTYVHVNQKEGEKAPPGAVRFGSALLLVAVLGLGLWWLAGTGPASDPGGHEGHLAAQGETQEDDPFVLRTLALPGGGVYVGYPSDLYAPAHAEAYDLEAARDIAMAYFMDHPGMQVPQAVTMADGTVIGYDVRPLT